MTKYEYDYPMASVCADAVVIRFDERSERDQVLLVQRNNEPFAGCYALPGGFLEVEEDADLKETAIRELREETGLDLETMYKLGVYSDINRDPRGRVISAAYIAEIQGEVDLTIDLEEIRNADWFYVDDLPKLAFDHAQIIEDAMEELVNMGGNPIVNANFVKEI